VLLLAACQANQFACVGTTNGLFTARLLDVAQKDESLSYRDLYVRVRRRFSGWQSPFYWGAGPHHGEFGYQRAFSISGSSYLNDLAKGRSLDRDAVTPA
jgi:hypothetical protein